MRRHVLTMLAGLATALATVVAVVVAPPAVASDAPIGRIGDTLRVDFDDPSFGRIVADVTVHDVLPTDVPPGWGWNGTPRWRAQGGPWRAPVTVHAVQVRNRYAMALAFTFDGLTPYDDAYVSKHTDAPDALESALLNAPPGSTVDGGVYWDVYRGLVTNVVLMNPKTGQHLAQWNLWEPGTPLP
jgi:hypothetical protein